MAPRKHSREFRRARARPEQASAAAAMQQNVGPGSASEVERLTAHVEELLAKVRRLEFEIHSLRDKGAT